MRFRQIVKVQKHREWHDKPYSKTKYHEVQAQSEHASLRYNYDQVGRRIGDSDACEISNYQRAQLLDEQKEHIRSEYHDGFSHWPIRLE